MEMQTTKALKAQGKEEIRVRRETRGLVTRIVNECRAGGLPTARLKLTHYETAKYDIVLLPADLTKQQVIEAFKTAIEDYKDEISKK